MIYNTKELIQTEMILNNIIEYFEKHTDGDDASAGAVKALEIAKACIDKQLYLVDLMNDIRVGMQEDDTLSEALVLELLADMQAKEEDA